LNFEVIGFGALNVDKLYSVDKIAGVGEERVVKNCVETAGGSAANTVVGLARLGHKVGYIGKVGDNREGKFLLRSFIDEKVDTKGVILSKGEMSGVVIGFVDSEGERSLYVNPGANNTLDFAEIDRDYANDAVFLHLSSFFGEKQFEIQVWETVDFLRRVLCLLSVHKTKISGIKWIAPENHNFHKLNHFSLV